MLIPFRIWRPDLRYTRMYKTRFRRYLRKGMTARPIREATFLNAQAAVYALNRRNSRGGNSVREREPEQKAR